jgi:hypothetical protein
MTKKIFISGLAVILLCSSCKTTSYYYQVFNVQPKEEMQNNGNSLVYTDANCTVSYNFWGDGGNIGFAITNNSDENIYLNKRECFFVCNGYAYDYFQNRTYTTTVGSQTSTAGGQTSTVAAVFGAVGMAISGRNAYGYNLMNAVAVANYAASSAKSVSNSTSREEAEIICIPPKTTKVVSEFEKITNTLIRNCELSRYPKAKQGKTNIIYSETNSPLVFSNKLAYSLGNSKDLIRIDNDFYASKIANLHERNVLEKIVEEQYCGERVHPTYEKLRWKDATPDKFYIRYTKSSSDPFSH